MINQTKFHCAGAGSGLSKRLFNLMVLTLGYIPKFTLGRQKVD